jgi:prepilin-type N-terminal cleavage/methylation domain-containing protein
VTQAQRTYPCSGYTMIEAIMVLVIVGILSVAVLTRSDSITARNVSDQADLLRRDLSRVQSVALTFGVPLRFNVLYTTRNVCTTTGGITTCALIKSDFFYKVTCPVALANSPCTIAGMDFTDPGTQEIFRVSLPAALSLSAVNSAGAVADTLDFDSIGRPSTGNALIATNPARTFAITGAARTSSVILRPVTGFAEVSY